MLIRELLSRYEILGFELKVTMKKIMQKNIKSCSIYIFLKDHARVLLAYGVFLPEECFLYLLPHVTLFY